MKDSAASSGDAQFFDHLDICCQKLAEEVIKKPISAWRDIDYKQLSSMLNRKTNVLLSETTLKRIFGRLKTSERYFPQKATRDALAQFLGYRDWQEFELAYPLEKKAIDAYEPQEEPLAPAIAAATLPHKRKKLPVALWAGVFAMIVVLCGWLFWPKSDGFDKVKDIRLQCLNPVGIVPHSALFTLFSDKPLPPEAASLEVDFGEQKHGTPFVQSRVTNHMYNNPGVQYAVLSYNKRPIDTVTVYMQTKGWVANSSIENDSIRVYPVSGLRELQADNIFVSAAELKSSGLDTSDAFLVGFSYIKPSTIDGDNCELTAWVKSTAERPRIRCSDVVLFILGEKDRHYIRVVKPTCTALAGYKFSEQIADGELTDQRGLGYDLSGGARVTLRIANKKVALKLNDTTIFTTSYKESIGKVRGLKFVFNGIGKVVSPRLIDLHTGETY